MNYFMVTQVCPNCFRGAKVFRIDISLFDDKTGRLSRSVQYMECFTFVCHFCWKRCRLDFYRFSHHDIILHIKCLHNYFKKLQNEIRILNNVINNLQNILRKLNE